MWQTGFIQGGAPWGFKLDNGSSAPAHLILVRLMIAGAAFALKSYRNKRNKSGPLWF
jgi:hypothetical protein